jgi:acyl-CoA synthetase (AMP-forming)/AMP-acid ligase II
VPDLVPHRLRRAWVAAGHCPDRDLWTAFRATAAAHPARVAVVSDAEGEVTYGELAHRAALLAAGLRAAGLAGRHVVATRLAPTWRTFAADLAIAALGGLALPCLPGHGARDLAALLGTSRAVALLTDPDADADADTDAVVHGLRDRLPYLRTVAAVDALVAAGAREAPFEPEPVEPEAPARVLVSSGSEAAPKMVVYSHNALLGGRGSYVAAALATGTTGAGESGAAAGADPTCASAAPVSAAPGAAAHENPAAPAPVSADPGAGAHQGPGGRAPARLLLLVPPASSFGSLALVALVRCGATVLLPPSGRFDPGWALRAVGWWRPTHVAGVPTMLRRMAEHDAAPGEDLSSLGAVISSGAALTPPVLGAVLGRFRRPLLNVYGSTDGVNCRAVWREPSADVRWAGRPDPAVTGIRVCDAEGRPVPPGEAGEIQARGPMTPLGHLGDPGLDARNRAPGGWVRTGDLGVLDAHGELHVVGRLRQVVNRGGRTLSPAEVEALAEGHPALAEAVCVAVPDEELGERLCVCVVPRAGMPAPTLAELCGWLTDRHGLERHKLPERLVVLDALPLAATGKVCRRTVTALAHACTAAY